METTLLHSTFPSLTHNSTRFHRVNSLRPPFHNSLKFNPLPLSFSLRYRAYTCFAESHTHHQHQHQHHGHDHHHHHHHQHPDDCAELSGPQKALIKFAKATRWLDFANFLREHLQLCCSAAALFVAAAACPYLLPKPAVKPLQNAFIAVAFPLVGVSASLDALTDIVGGRVNIHVLMALAAFASVFMGNALEGGLLLAMFNLAHIAEEFFTSRSMVDVKELKDNYPDSALVLNVNDDNVPDISDLAYKSIPVHDVEVGSYILVGAGEEGLETKKKNQAKQPFSFTKKNSQQKYNHPVSKKLRKISSKTEYNNSKL